MPYYNTSAFAPLPEVAIPAKPAYFFGKLPIDTDDTYLRVSSVGLASNVATVTGTIFRGNIPAVGNQISVQGTKTSAGAFNVSSATILSVGGTPSTGVYSITFALTSANVGTTSDSGMALIPIAETSEALANGTSIAIYIPSNELRDLGQRSVTVATTFPSLPTAATVTLYTAISNTDNPTEWTSMGVVATVAGGAVTVPTGAQANGGTATFTTPAGRFVQLVITGVSGGTLPTIIAKMVC
jgi:hypothetical protein